MDALRTRISVALGALAAFQLLHLLDELRTDSTKDLAEVALRPQPISGIGFTLLSLFLLRRGVGAWRPLAMVTTALITIGFLLSHGNPNESGSNDPYWGDGSADALEWFGFLAILATCAFIFTRALRMNRGNAALAT